MDKPKEPISDSFSGDKSISKGISVFSIIGFLLVIGSCALILHTQYRQDNPVRNRPSPDSLASHDLKKAFTAAQEYFRDYPKGELNISLLKSYGFSGPYSGVTIEIPGNDQNSLRIRSEHKDGDKVYFIDSSGAVTSIKK